MRTVYLIEIIIKCSRNCNYFAKKINETIKENVLSKLINFLKRLFMLNEFLYEFSKSINNIMRNCKDILMNFALTIEREVIICF